MNFCLSDKQGYIKLDYIWSKKLKHILEKSYFKNILLNLENEYKTKNIFPPEELIFNAFNLCKYDDLKVVIIGQDPYINPGQANGLAFSVNKNIKLPPSLRNIFIEIQKNFGLKLENTNGDLSYLAKQGVLLLNSVLTVQEGISMSHKKLGWEYFTDDVISYLSEKKKEIVYILWGNYAKSKINMIDKNNNLILTSAHPSPFSASKFFNNNHFYKTNEYLKEHGKGIIKWWRE